MQMFQDFAQENINEKQQELITELELRFNKRTEKSKQWMQECNKYHADPSVTKNYISALKNLKYPIVAAKSSGAKIWDIDGNEYLDMSMGNGVSFLGHNPDFVTKAIKEQLKSGMHLGPQFHLTGKLANLIAKMSNFDRVFFSNTGTEAIMSVARIVRAYTGRWKHVIFENAHYGHYDGFQAKKQDEDCVSKNNGTPNSMVQDVIILKYGTEESLKFIEENADSIAGVFVEPFQRCAPDFKPSKSYIQQLSKITKFHNIGLVFNELITGFRFHPQGAAAYFEVEPDVSIYGKFIAGGMPMSVIVGKTEFMDMIDGGSWNFGDSSHPNVKMTAVAGTFCKHPLAVVAALEVMSYLKSKGDSLQREVNERTQKFVDNMNTFFNEKKVPLIVEYFGSFFCLKDTRKNKYIALELLFCLLLEKGIFISENRTCFLSSVHTDEDMNIFESKVKECVARLRESNFFV